MKLQFGPRDEEAEPTCGAVLNTAALLEGTWSLCKLVDDLTS